MTKRQASVLGKRIEREDPRCIVTGYRRWGRGDYEVEVRDFRTGYTFVVGSASEWEERLRAQREG